VWVVKFRQLDVAVTYEPVVTYLNTTHGAEEDRVRGHHVDESACATEKFPWTHGDGNDETDVCATANVDVFWK